MRPLTVRDSLIGLFLFLGLGLVLSVALHCRDALSEWREARETARSNLVRQHLTRASLAVGEERTASYLRLVAAHHSATDVAEVREETDGILSDTERTFAQVDHLAALADLRKLEGDLGALRRVVEAAMGRSSLAEREEMASSVFAGYSDLVAHLFSLRLAILAQENPTDPKTSSIFLMRRFLSLLLENLALNRAILVSLDGNEASGLRGQLAKQAERNGHRAEMAAGLLEARAPYAGGETQTLATEFATADFVTYRQIEEEMISWLGEGAPPARLAEQWNKLAQQAASSASSLLEALFRQSEERLAMQMDSALQRAVLWGVLLVAGIGVFFVGAGVVIGRVIRPFEGLRSSMLALAEGDLDAPLPKMHRQDELAAMADALRVFKANAIRRARLQDKQLELHERLKGAYQQLRGDLQSAAAVQAAVIPPSSRIGGVRFAGRLRPSHGISGDTFDVLRQPNGDVHFFMIDVAGHGAAAALVSVASHYSVAQAIQQRPAGVSLSETVAALNRSWSERMPYFTIIVGELRPETGEGVLVQAGHPAPLLLHCANGVEALGRGGLPIGVLPEADFEEIHFPFGPGNRLLIFSDGLTEAEDASGQAFGEERVKDLLFERRECSGEDILDAVAERLRDWRAGGELDDDMTLLLLEAVEDGPAPARGGRVRAKAEA